MTKNVRIENADNSAHKVRVRRIQKQSDGAELVLSTVVLENPTDMTAFTIYYGVHIVIDEVPMS